jgi:DNA-binding transcriptional LysR family regulator
MRRVASLFAVAAHEPRPRVPLLPERSDPHSRAVGEKRELARGAVHRVARCDGCERADADDLTEEPFVDLAPEWPARRLLDRLWSRTGTERRSPIVVNDVQLLLDCVAHGLGIAVVPRLVSPYADRIRFVELAPPVPSWRLLAAHLGKQPASAAVREFCQMLRPRDPASKSA